MGLQLKNIDLQYGKQSVLKNISFTINEGEIVTLFGPSGVGKTSLLKMIAGIQPAAAGEIIFDGFKQEEVILVFQDFWLFPHMTVLENIAFGLKVRRKDKQVIAEKVAEMLQIFDLKELAKQYPSQLSGGQKQRVALARALILAPRLLLLDEPFSNLDSHLRLKMREYLLKLQKEFQFSVLLVTHDQEEAFLLSDKMVILLDQEVQQIASPKEIYYQPKNKKVANFIGEMNYLSGMIDGNIFQIGDQEILLKNEAKIKGDSEVLIPYASQVDLVEVGVEATVGKVFWRPNGYQVTFSVAGQSLILNNLSVELKAGQTVYLEFPRELQVIAL
ncbi:ABC transporter ATP-binding protein [Enterococcus sp. AZ103]|uniref:ABC transporter ATP-binding protein n=1 Tax=Enterococcus sp. AZ103 TaxID=2774628 RepID=UPI003F26C280